MLPLPSSFNLTRQNSMSMTAETYERMAESIRRRPNGVRALVAVDRVLTGVGYVAYPLLIVLLLAARDPDVLWYVVVPGVAFVLLSVVRKALNFPRPYEALDIRPLIHKDTQGKSMPSRHVFSMTAIAMCWLAHLWPVGVALLVTSLVMAVIRLIGGVHFVRDVVVGFACGVLAGVVLLLLVA